MNTRPGFYVLITEAAARITQLRSHDLLVKLNLRAKNPPRRWPEVNHTVPHTHLAASADLDDGVDPRTGGLLLCSLLGNPHLHVDSGRSLQAQGTFFIGLLDGLAHRLLSTS